MSASRLKAEFQPPPREPSTKTRCGLGLYENAEIAGLMQHKANHSSVCLANLAGHIRVPLPDSVRVVIYASLPVHLVDGKTRRIALADPELW